MGSLRQIIYVSQATKPLAQSELRELVITASKNNMREDITGALMYLENWFVQILEGFDGPITLMLERIEADHRHKNMRIISDKELDHRFFEDWSMGYVEPDIRDSSIIIKELRSPLTSGDRADTVDMPLPQTFAMMKQLYKTDQALQRAKT
jgi:Sensors of blue-light using FAD